ARGVLWFWRPSAVVCAAGLDRTPVLVGALRPDGKNLVVSWRLDSPDRADLVTRALGGPPVDRRMIDLLPADTQSFSLFSLDLNAVLQALRARLAAGEIEGALEELKQAGVDLAEVLDAFGPRGALANVAPPLDPDPKAIARYLEGTAWIIEVRDEAKARRLLSGLPQKLGAFDLSRREVEGHEVSSYRLGDESAGRSLSVSWTLKGGYLLGALSPSALDRLLAVDPAAPGNGLREQIGGAPERAVTLSYEDLRRTLPLTLGMLLEGLSSLAALPDSDPGDRRGLTAQLGSVDPQVSYTVVDKGGVTHVTRSPTAGVGGLGGVVGLLQVTSLAVPNLLASRRDSNEHAAVATLREILEAQQAFRSAAVRDTDRDGEGEYGFLAELMGERSGRGGLAGGSSFLRRAVKRGAGGHFESSGYRFRVYLPAEDGAPVGGHEPPERMELVDGDLAEDVMVVVAWPLEKGTLGQRAFFAEPGGGLYACAAGPYEGEQAPPADVLSSQRDNLACALLDPSGPARDGLRWERVR
ncbi:MAG: hypothetical protein ACE5JG_08455, partial [Planctomycetota bacterium]